MNIKIKSEMPSSMSFLDNFRLNIDLREFSNLFSLILKNYLYWVNVVGYDDQLGFLLLDESDDAVDSVADHRCALSRRISLQIKILIKIITHKFRQKDKTSETQ